MGSVAERTVVVGAGVAGCAIAGRLARTGEVIVLDAGPRVVAEDVPVDVHRALATPELTHRDLAVRRVADGPLVAYPAGRGVGGGALVNGLVIDDRSGPLPAETVETAEFGAVDRTLARALPARPLVLARREGRRVAIAEHLLGDAEVRPGATVSGLMLDGDRVEGVETDSGPIEADHVVVAAGAFSSPQLLLAAGLGGDDVGCGLQDHPSVTVPLRTSSRFVGPVSGAVARIGSVEVLPVNRLAASSEPDRAGIVVALLDPVSRGRVTLDTIDLNLLDSTTDDEARLVDGVVAVMREVAPHLVAEGLALDPSVPDPDDRGALTQWVRSEVASSAPAYTHAAGSCSVGVIDDRHRVHGAGGLSLLDASVLPGVPSGSMMTAILARALHSPLGR